MICPDRILEIGTYTGYSAICWAEGLSKTGQLHTIDINEELKDMVDRYLEESGVSNQVFTYVGNAIDIIPSINEVFDVVFIDQPVKKYRDVLKADSDLNIKYNKALRKRGLFKATGKCYPSLALTDEDIEITKNAVKETVLNLI